MQVATKSFQRHGKKTESVWVNSFLMTHILFFTQSWRNGEFDIMYRVERKKPRLVDRFSDELLRGFSPFPLERGEMWDVSLPPFTPSHASTSPRRRRDRINGIQRRRDWQ